MKEKEERGAIFVTGSQEKKKEKEKNHQSTATSPQESTTPSHTYNTNTMSKKRAADDEEYDEDDFQEGGDDDFFNARSAALSGKNKKGGRGRPKKSGVGTVASSSSSASNTRGGRRGRDPLEDEPKPMQDCSMLMLKRDHERRPIWVTGDNTIILEAFSPYYSQAYDFLIDIAEPEARPEYIQTYRLTEDSLYAAVAVSRSAESIIKVLNILCKTEVPAQVIKYIKDCTHTFGKAKLVLKENNFYVESQYPDVLRLLLSHPTIKEARVFDAQQSDQTTGAFLESIAPQEDRRNVDYSKLDMDMDDDDDDELMGEDGAPAGLKTVSFMVAQSRVQEVKRIAKEECKYPLLEEYDFRNDRKNPALVMDLRPSTTIRPYQERSLAKMFGNGRARSGIIVLPCGAGKSLTGVTAATTIKRSCMVLCINTASVKQWKEQFTTWTTISPSSVKLFTSGNKEPLPPLTEACIVITTYAMICHGGRRSEVMLSLPQPTNNRIS